MAGSGEWLPARADGPAAGPILGAAAGPVAPRSRLSGHATGGNLPSQPVRPSQGPSADTWTARRPFSERPALGFAIPCARLCGCR